MRFGEMVGMMMDKLEYSDREGVCEPVAVRVVGKGDKERCVPLSPTAQRALYQLEKHSRLEGRLDVPFVWVNTVGEGHPGMNFSHSLEFAHCKICVWGRFKVTGCICLSSFAFSP
jgi:site-specific recombinase XerD